MKTTFLILGLALAALTATPGYGEEDTAWSERVDAATAYTFSGKMVFHDNLGNVRYDLTVTNGQVTGAQYWKDEAKPVGEIVGGWFDFERGRLSVLIQGADHVRATWRSQMKQFHLDLPARQLTLEYELYNYGETREPLLLTSPHILDVLDRVEHLVK